MQTYKVRRPFTHDETFYKRGDEIQLSEADAQPLLEDKSIKIPRGVRLAGEPVKSEGGDK